MQPERYLAKLLNDALRAHIPLMRWLAASYRLERCALSASDWSNERGVDRIKL